MASILIVDDDGAVRSTVRQLLEALGHEVIEASNGQEALDRVESTPFDLIVMDLVMPVKNGIDAIVELRRRNCETNILAISGGGRHGHLELLPIASLLGANASIAKPFDLTELIIKVEAELARPYSPRRSQYQRTG